MTTFMQLKRLKKIRYNIKNKRNIYDFKLKMHIIVFYYLFYLNFIIFFTSIHNKTKKLLVEIG